MLWEIIVPSLEQIRIPDLRGKHLHCVKWLFKLSLKQNLKEITFLPSDDSSKMITDSSHSFFVLTKSVFISLEVFFPLFTMNKILSQLMLLKLGQKMNLARKRKGKERKEFLFRR